MSGIVFNLDIYKIIKYKGDEMKHNVPKIYKYNQILKYFFPNIFICWWCEKFLFEKNSVYSNGRHWCKDHAKHAFELDFENIINIEK